MPEPQDTPWPDLVVFDMDRTLLADRVALRWGRELELEDQILGIIQKRQQGEIDGSQSATQIAALWAGQKWSRLEALVEETPLNPGARTTVRALREHAVPTAILTDSYVQAAEVVRRRVGADYAMGLVLTDEGGRLTGGIVPPAELPPDAQPCQYSFFCKEHGIRALAAHFNARLDRTVMIGDSDPDACAMRITGRGIAFDPIGSVTEAATDTVTSGDLRDVLGILDMPPPTATP
jgi:HAD superfamily phosphoserine phosphatase-like hydrolase